jgi:phosphatidate phosphatase APP1
MMRGLLLAALLLPLIAGAESSKVVLYDGYGSGEHFVIEGCVIEADESSQATPGDSASRNLWRNLHAMKRSEREDLALTVKAGAYEAHTISDDEGCFRVEGAPGPPLSAGWYTVTAQGRQAQGRGKLLVVHQTNALGIISDIDDTVLVSEVLDKQRLLAHTFLQNPQQRQAVPGVADFYQRLLGQNAEPDSAPLFYVSASPRQLAGNISSFLSQNHFPQGVLVTKQIDGDGSDALFDQKQYKIGKIEAIFAALPWVKFVLVGDDGEFDPETYRAIQEKYPRRVIAVYIRKVNPDPKRVVYSGQRDLAGALRR